MRVIQFLEPVKNDFIGPFSDEMTARRWLEENGRTEKCLIHSLTDPCSEMFGLSEGTVPSKGE